MDGGPGRRVREIEILGVDPVQDVRRHSVGQIWNHENHVAKVDSGKFKRSAHAIDRELDLGFRVLGDLAGVDVAREMTGKEKAITHQYAGA